MAHDFQFQYKALKIFNRYNVVRRSSNKYNKLIFQFKIYQSFCKDSNVLWEIIFELLCIILGEKPNELVIIIELLHQLKSNDLADGFGLDSPFAFANIKVSDFLELIVNSWIYFVEF